ncbi:hypothetical protein QU845_24770, partial [Escherichia coli]|nr:hypothetical protein [Escherichia coli]
NQIASKIHRSRHVDQIFLNDPQNYGKNFSKSGNAKLSPRDKRQIIWEFSKSGASSASICCDLNLPVSSR